MFDIGLQELVLIFVIALLVFGPKNLPQLGRSLGRAMREFRRASDEFRSTIETNLEMNEPDPVSRPATEPTPTTPVATTDGGALPESMSDPYGVAEPQAEVAVADLAEPYVAQRGAKLFHGRSCAWVSKIAQADRVPFKRVADAKDAGLAPCPVCEPWEPA